MKFLILLAIFITSGDASKILCVFYMPSYSHYILDHRLAEELTKRGHEVTVIHSVVKNTKEYNYTTIHLDGFEEILEKSSNTSISDLSDVSPIIMAPIMYNFGLQTAEYVLRHESFQKILGNKYDLVILEQFLADALIGLCHHFKSACIGLSALGASPMSNYVVSNPAPASYVASNFLTFSSEMSFMERLQNFAFQIYCEAIYHLYFIPKQDALLHDFFPNAPHIYEVIKMVDLILLNSHPSATQAVPLVPKMIEIGGMHITPTKELPQDIKKFLDEAKDGAIFFSLGSNVVSAEAFPMEKRRSILKAISKLKQRVLWKFEEDAIEGKPDNLMISKWLPQPDILAHPNVKLFITHGGLLSTLEATYYGVPLIGVPFFGDQHMNMAENLIHKVGLKINYKDLNGESLTEAINEVLRNKIYQENMSKRSALMKDRPIPPLEEAVYWVEFVLRHGGKHLQVQAINLAWYQYLLLDVIGFIVIILIVPIVLITKTIKKIVIKIKSKKIAKKKNQ